MNPPYSEGPLSAKICFIGEAPGEDEEIAQRPFVGSAGKAFDRLLARAGINRQECRIENVIQERPPGNNISSFIDLSKKTPFTTAKAQQYIDALLTRLEQCEANVFVPLGNVPLWTLTGLKDITKRRGSILKAIKPQIADRKVIPSIHPAAALRQYIFNHFIAVDLQRIKLQSEEPGVHYLERNLLLEPSYKETLHYISSCSRSGNAIGFDIEVTRNEVSHVSLSISSTDAICIPFFDSGKDYFSPDQEAEVWQALKKLLENPSVTKIGQNITFDNTFVFTRYGIIVRPIEDTMVAAAITHPDFPKGLDFLCSMYCDGEPYYKDEGKKWFKNPFGSVLDFRKYSAMDAAVLHQIFPKQIAVLNKQGNLDTYQRQKRIIEPLTYIACRGIKMSKAGLNQAAIEADAKIRELQAELDSITGTPLNVASYKQVKTYFYVLKGERPYVNKGTPTVDDTAMARLAAKGYREAGIIQQIRHLKKLKGTYYEVILDKDERLRCSWNPVGTKQGRVSSSKTIFDTGANLQNQPDEMLRLMRADEGFIMVKQDLSQAENRDVAYRANELNMVRAFEQEMDIHAHTASMMFNVNMAEVTHEQRQSGKKANHGLNYGMYYLLFAILNNMPNPAAKFIYDRYHFIYPGIHQWHNTIRSQLATNRTLVNAYGRHRIFMDRWGDDMFKEAYSFGPQSDVAEKLNQDGICYSYYDGPKQIDLLNNIHDAALYQLPLSIGANRIIDIAIEVKLKLESSLTIDGRTFSIPVDTSFGFNALDMIKFKSNELSAEETIIKLQEFIDEQSPSRLA
jgi:uracil-DNA glycosylase family 4